MAKIKKTNIFKHKSGLETWVENGIPVMKCPSCGTENEWPYDYSGYKAECMAGCGEVFEYDERFIENSKDF